jgi:hypothetical protein
MAGLGTLVIAFGLFIQDPRVVVGAQVATIFGVTVLNIALTRYLHDAMPSTVRAGASSVVSTIGYGTFVPTALGFGDYSRSHGIFAASVFVVVPLGVMCFAVACARRWRTEAVPQPVQQPIDQLLALSRLQQSHRLIAPGTQAGPARPRYTRDIPCSPYWWPADRVRQPAVAGPNVNRVGEPAKSLASNANTQSRRSA